MTDQPMDVMPPQVNGLSVWFEIPVSDLDKAQQFYEAVLQTKMTKTTDPSTPNEMVWFNDPQSPVASGHLYPGKPAPEGQGNTIHMLATDRLEDVMVRVGPAGGEVVSPIIDIPAGRFVYIVDPDGNSIGLFNWKQ
ncbi:MAG: VOC family protein [Pseudomonadota bacterium]